MNSNIPPVIALLIAIGIFFAYINPTWSGSIATTKAAIASDNQALAAADEYSAQQNQLASARAAINAADLTRLNVFLPDSVDNVQLILDLTAIAARSGLILSNVGISADAASSASAGMSSASPINSVNLTLSAAGTYSALQSFLREIERSQRLLDVQDLLVTSSNTGVYTYQMTIRLYWLR